MKNVPKVEKSALTYLQLSNGAHMVVPLKATNKQLDSLIDVLEHLDLPARAYTPGLTKEVFLACTSFGGSWPPYTDLFEKDPAPALLEKLYKALLHE